MYFFELREGDEDIYSDLIVARDEEMSAADFFELVGSIRARIVDSYEDDTLIEAIASELEREHGFTFVSDDRLVASVNVSENEGENFLVALSDDTAADDTVAADYRGIVLDWDAEGGRAPD